MRRNLIKALLIVFCISFFHLFGVSPAPSQEAGLKAGGFQWGGDIELGYRFTDIDGSKDRYKYVTNLQSGLKLFDLTLWGKSLEEDAKGLVDSLRFNVSNLGDPYPSAQLQIKKNSTYDLKMTYKQYQYINYREDANVFSGNQFSLDTTIRRGSLLFSVFPKDSVKVNFGYNYIARDGDAGVPRIGSFFPMEQDLKEQVNEYFVSADFPVAGWDFHIRQSIWNYSNKDKINAPVYEDRDESVWTYVSTIKGHTQFGERLDFDAAYIYAHSEGDADLKTYSPGKGDTNFNTHVVEAGLSYLLRKDLILHLDYRFHALDQDGTSFTVGSPDISPTSYNLTANTGTFQLEYIPFDNLTLRGGYRLQYQHTYGDTYADNVYNGGQNTTSNTNWVNGWVASVDWKPYKVLKIFGEYQGANFSNPYTWISYENQNVARIKIKYDTPIQNLSLKGAFNWRRNSNPQQEFQSDVQDYIFALIYRPIPKVTFDGSFTYSRLRDGKDLFDPIPFQYVRYTWNSSYYIWVGGLTFDNLYEGFGGRLNGSYARSLGENAQNYVDGVVSFWYKNKLITPIVTLERTYLTDNVIHSNGFNANLITFSLRKDF